MHEDAYGRLLQDAFAGQDVAEIIERDDGMIWAGDPSDYFTPFRRWPARERQAMRFVRGRVLDVGCGAGRVSLHLQQLGRDVVAIDSSPAAVEVARHRGVRQAAVADVSALPPELGLFDTVLILRNNFGLGGSVARRPALLETLAARTTARGRVITDSVDPARIEPARRPTRDHRYRLRWLDAASPWFRYQMFAPDQADAVVRGSAWHVRRVLDDGSPRWMMILEKRQPSSPRQTRR
jgi:SAM-dependent methyltransferase